MEFSLKDIYNWLIKGIAFILIIAVLFGIGAFVYTKYFVQPRYEANVKFYASNKESGNTYGDATRSIAWQYIEFLNVNEFFEMVSKDLEETTGRTLAPKVISGYVSFSSVVSETSTFYVSVQTHDPNLSYDIALSVSNTASKRIDSFQEVGALEVIQSPELPVSPVNANALEKAIFGFLVGALLAAGLVVLKELSDNRIRSAEEITELFGLPVLGIVPDFNAGEKKGGI